MKGRILGKVVGRTPVLGLVAALLAARQRLWVRRRCGELASNSDENVSFLSHCVGMPPARGLLGLVFLAGRPRPVTAFG